MNKSGSETDKDLIYYIYFITLQLSTFNEYKFDNHMININNFY